MKEKKDTWFEVKLNSCFKIVLVWSVSYINCVLGHIFEGSIGYKLIFHFRNVEMKEFGLLIHSFSALRPLSWFSSHLWSYPQLQRVLWLGLCLLAQPEWVCGQCVTPNVRQWSLVAAGLLVVAGLEWKWTGPEWVVTASLSWEWELTKSRTDCPVCDIVWITSYGSCECLAVLFLGELLLWLLVLFSS